MRWASSIAPGLAALIAVGCGGGGSAGRGSGSSGGGGEDSTGGSSGTGGEGAHSGASGGGIGGQGTGGAGQIKDAGAADASMSMNTGGATGGQGGTVGGGACGAPGIIVCDNFEAGFARWVKHPMAAGSVTLDNTRGHSGTTSVKITSGNGPFSHFSAPPGSIPATKDFYVRAWAYFTKSTAQIAGHVAYIVGATAEDNSGVEVRFGSSATFAASRTSMLDLNLIGSGSEFTQFSNGDITGGAGTANPGVALQANRWYCLEVFYKGSTSEFQAWVDEQEVTGLHVTDFGGRRANWAPRYTLVKVGGQDFSGAIGTVWYDDVAMGAQRIHCNQ